MDSTSHVSSSASESLTPVHATPVVDVFSTCPTSKDADAATYLQQVIDVAKWSEEAGCRGILVYTDNGLVDPWLVSQIIIQNTQRLVPLVAVQPAYMHPYFVAKKIATLAFLHKRPVALNLVAGGFKNDLTALNDQTPHDERYARLTEYAQVIKGALEQPTGLTFEGEYYTVRNLKMVPPLPEELRPQILLSGSSEAGINAARAINATAIKYPKPSSRENKPEDSDLSTGVRVGVIARETDKEAWEIAEDRFPPDRQGQLAHQLAMKVSDSHWHRQLSDEEERPGGAESPYWMRPFHNYKTFCPYLVGDYQKVAKELAGYLQLGARTFILDIPPAHAELQHTRRVFDLVSTIATP